MHEHSPSPKWISLIERKNFQLATDDSTYTREWWRLCCGKLPRLALLFRPSPFLFFLLLRCELGGREEPDWLLPPPTTTSRSMAAGRATAAEAVWWLLREWKNSAVRPWRKKFTLFPVCVRELTGEKIALLEKMERMIHCWKVWEGKLRW